MDDRRSSGAVLLFDACAAVTGGADPWGDAMRDGDTVRALALHDRALADRVASGDRPDDPALPFHHRFVWNGAPVDGRRVLVRCYHGLGDTLMASRFLAPLARRAASVTVEAPAPLVTLLGRLRVAAAVVAFDHRSPLPSGEVDVEIMELAHALRLGPADPAAVPVPPPVDASPLAPGTIGFCWRAGEWLAARSVPIALLAPVLRAAARPLLSLQHGPALGPAREAFPDLFGGPGRPDDDVGRTASLLAGAAVVVSVDTMVAHLALLLGRPTIVLLRADADWRWGRQGGRSPWYGDAVLLRQDRDGDWAPVLARLARALGAAPPVSPTAAAGG